jgi:dienelactone hydrolase
MTHIALFHSVLGVRPGVLEAADRLRAAGHDVRVVDQYDGRVFDDYEEAGAYAESIGYPALMARAVDLVADLPDGFVAMGFSNGGGMAEYVATRRAVSKVVQLSGTMPLAMLDAGPWPAAVPVQIHYAVDDPFRNQDWIDAFVAEVRTAGAALDLHLDYPGRGHLFTDETLPEEYDAESAELLWKRVISFVNDR